MVDRITILGGSSVYIPEFIVSAISNNLNVKEIVLFAPAGRKLEIVSAFCQRLLHRSGFPAKVTPSSDIAEAVNGAKYIINHIRVGGMRARMRDEMLPPRMSMIGDETLGAGGFANAMRTLPVLLDYAKHIEEVNPSATLINLANPMSIIIEALNRYTKLHAIGLCDQPETTIRKVATLLLHPPEELSFDYIGLHHLGWIQDVRYDNRSKMSKLLEVLETREEEGFDFDLIELFRMIPTEATGKFFHRAEILKKQQACSRFRAEVLYEAEVQILKLYENKHLCEVPDLTRQRNTVWYEESLLPVIRSLEGAGAKDHILCVRNGESIRDLPEDCSVEIPVTVCKTGLKPKKAGSLPRFLRGLYLGAKESERLAIEAVVHRSYEYALQSLTINPFVSSMETAKQFLDKILKDEKLELY